MMMAKKMNVIEKVNVEGEGQSLRMKKKMITIIGESEDEENLILVKMPIMKLTMMAIVMQGRHP